MSISRGLRRAATLLGALTAATVLAACSSSGAPGGTPSTTPGDTASDTVSSAATGALATTAAVPAPTTGATTQVRPAGATSDKAVLSALLLTKADVPAGWTATPSQKSAQDDPTQAKFAQCVGIPNSQAHRVAEVDSPNFGNNVATISSSATSYASAADVTSDAKAFQNASKATACMTSLMRTEMASQLSGGTTIKNVQLTVAPGPGDGPTNVIARVTGSLEVATGGQQLTLYLDITYLATGRIEAEVDYASFGSPVDQALRLKAVKAVSDRLAAA